MEQAIFWVDRPYLNNEMFNRNNSALNRDGCLEPYIFLKERFYSRSVDLVTQDICGDNDPLFVLFSDIPRSSIIEKYKNIKKYLIIFESEIIKPWNWDLNIHKYFEKIFTWNDGLIDNEKYFKINFPNSFSIESSFPGFDERSEFCVMISGNKMAAHTLELYSERITNIRWFERNQPEKFSLYGVGWDTDSFKGVLNKVMKISRLYSLFDRQIFPSYRGKVERKSDVLRNAKFSICYENGRDIPGYITEKIFDCFVSGCVPVYLGVDSPEKVFGKDTFINKRSFRSYSELFDFMNGMSNEEYSKFQRNIKDFCDREMHGEFSSEFFVRQIVNNILS